MRVLLVNVDSIIPNFALEKIRVYYERMGCVVNGIKDESVRALPLTVYNYDKIYVSCVFDYNKHFCKKWEDIAEIGGSGYSLKKCLPSKIERVKPKMNFGFATRGCIRNCPWCIVPEKEGKICAVADIYDIWDGQGKNITLLDNNILAMPGHFFKISRQLKGENLSVDFNQGLDHRLLTDEICQELFSLSYFQNNNIRFAFDHISYKKSVSKALRILRRNGLEHKRTRWYVYVGVGDTAESVLERINILRDAGQLVFVMRDRKVQDNLEFKKMYTWACDVAAYVTVPYSEYVRNRKAFTIEGSELNLFDEGELR